MEQERDVIVVGAGPSGSTAAAALAQKGHDVLLLDRASFPRDKTCGDAVPAGAMRILRGLGMNGEINAARERGELYLLQGMRIISPRGNLLRAEFGEAGDLANSYVAPRYYFDTLIERLAEQSGAEFRQATVKGPEMENGRVVGVRVKENGSAETLRAKVVIGADGVTSTLTRALRPREQQHVDKHRAVALRAYVQGLEIHPGDVEFFLYDEILPGYSWIFPIGEDKANVGLGMRLDYFRKHGKNLEEMLDDFLAMPEVRKRLKPDFKIEGLKTWQLNFGSQKGLQHAFNGALLVGDAAGFINPLTGGGIHNGMVSAQLAAETVDRALQRGDTSRQGLLAYEQRVDERLGPSMKRAYLIQRWLLRFPRVVDFITARTGQNSALAQMFLEKL